MFRITSTASFTTVTPSGSCELRLSLKFQLIVYSRILLVTLHMNELDLFFKTFLTGGNTVTSGGSMASRGELRKKKRKKRCKKWKGTSKIKEIKIID